jgi:hypothetical protein
MEPPTVRRRAGWLSAGLVPLVVCVGSALWLSASTDPGCAGRQHPFRWGYILLGLAPLITAAICIRVKERVGAIVGLSALTLALTAFGLFWVAIRWGAEHGCWS